MYLNKYCIYKYSKDNNNYVYINEVRYDIIILIIFLMKYIIWHSIYIIALLLFYINSINNYIWINKINCLILTK
jgi:hypothetical protein